MTKAYNLDDPDRSEPVEGEIPSVYANQEPHLRVTDLYNMGEFVEIPIEGEIEVGCFAPPPKNASEYKSSQPCPPSIRLYAMQGSEHVTHIQLEGMEISRNHGKFRRAQFDEVFYEDHSEKGSTKLEWSSKSRSPVKNASVMLAPNDGIYIGNFELTFFYRG